MIMHKIEARDLPDLWFQAVNDVLEIGRRFVIDRGSYEGQTRLEYDYFIGHIKHPEHGAGTIEILPRIPESMGMPDPVLLGYVYGDEDHPRSYVEYVMTDRKEPGESYTYGERLTKMGLERAFVTDPHNYGREHIVIQDKELISNPAIVIWKDGEPFLNQIELLIETYKKYGYRNNQMVLQIAQPTDMILQDPPCLRQIDTRIQDDKLHFFVYFRSWDLWGGLPANLAGIQFLQEYMAGELGVETGEMIVESKGLHLYGYAEDLAKLRCLKD